MTASRALLLLPAALFLALYLPALDHELVWMDETEIAGREIVVPPDALATAFVRPLHASATPGLGELRNPYYRPSRPRLVVGADGRLYEEWPVFLNIETPWFRHSVKVVLRDTGSGQVAYETTAAFDGPWSDTLNLLPPMLEAAFKDYPQPVRQRVVVELPAASPGAR